jgi:hypothetical protein
MAENEFNRIQTEYLKRLRHELRRVPPALQEDALQEVRGHIEDGCSLHPNDVSMLRLYWNGWGHRRNTVMNWVCN